MTDYKKHIDEMFSQYELDLKTLIDIPSVYQDDDSPYPYGKEVQASLEQMVKLSDKLGFRTYIDPEGHYAYAEIGEGQQMIGVLGHLDVVPAGDLTKWENDPFDMSVKDGMIFGRGVQDDKGPTLAAMYACKMLIDTGVKFNKVVRFIFGTDEETLWRGITEYAKKETMPDLGFTPDSKFPLIYSEKGLLQCKLVSKEPSNINLVGGDAFNSVPSKMIYCGNLLEQVIKELDALNFEYERKDDTIEIIGKSAHAQATEKGVNAISRLMIVLDRLNVESPSVKFISQMVGETYYGENIFGNVEDEHSGKLKFNVGKVSFSEQGEEICIDIRIPVQSSKEMVVDTLTKCAAEYNLEYLEHDWLRSIYVSQESDLIVSLMEAYQTVTGDYTSKPETSGGATYARAMDNCVAFGAVLPESDKTEHQPNERVSINDIKTAMEIYAIALNKLLNK